MKEEAGIGETVWQEGGPFNMRKLTTLALVAAVAFVLSACGKSDGKKANDAMKDMVSVMEQIADAAEKHGADCAKFATEMDKIIEANKEKLEKAKKLSDEMEAKYKDKKPEEAMEAMMKDMDPAIMGKMMELGMKMMDPMMKCSSDPKFQEVQKKWEKYQ